MSAKERRKICFVVTTPFTINGFFISHITKLAEQYDLTLCTNLDQYQLSPKLKTSNFQIINVFLERKIDLFKDLKAWFALLKIFRAHQFDSVHSVTPKAGLLAMTSAFFARIPIRLHTFTGQVWVTKSGTPRQFFKFTDWLIVKFSTLNFADSYSQIQFLIKEKICRNDEIRMLGPGSISGVDLSRFNPDQSTRQAVRDEFDVSSEQCVYLFVGRLCQDKGVFDLLGAFRKLYYAHQSAMLWIVGPDEERIREQTRVMSDGLLSRVKWIGPSFSPERYMMAADVLVLPSYREGFGSVIIEAAACGIPTIAYKIDGVVDAVEDTITGCLVDPGDVQKLYLTMKELLVNSTLRSKLGKAAQLRVEKYFSSQKITQAWVKFYQSLFEKKDA
jgi:glycosyltransferase involved in cell wall biosynthesis